MKTFKYIVNFAVFTCLVMFTLLMTKKISHYATDALVKCSRIIIPSVFPYVVITQVLTRFNISSKSGYFLSPLISPVMGIPKELCGAFITGVFGGFPNGVHATGIIYSHGKCSKKQAERCLALSNSCSVSFMITVAGTGAMGSIKNGFILLCSQLITLIISAQILKFTDGTPHKSPEIANKVSGKTADSKVTSRLCQSISESCNITLNICGYITVFYIISSLITEKICNNTAFAAVISGFIEITSGSIAVKTLNFPENFLICSTIIGFTGISVILQVSNASLKYGLSAKQFIFSRFISSIIMPVITTIILMICPLNAVSVFNNTHVSHTGIWNTNIVYATSAFIVILLFFIIYKAYYLIRKTH